MFVYDRASCFTRYIHKYIVLDQTYICHNTFRIGWAPLPEIKIFRVYLNPPQMKSCHRELGTYIAHSYSNFNPIGSKKSLAFSITEVNLLIAEIFFPVSHFSLPEKRCSIIFKGRDVTLVQFRICRHIFKCSFLGNFL